MWCFTESLLVSHDRVEWGKSASDAKACLGQTFEPDCLQNCDVLGRLSRQVYETAQAEKASLIGKHLDTFTHTWNSFRSQWSTRGLVARKHETVTLGNGLCLSVFVMPTLIGECIAVTD